MVKVHYKVWREAANEYLAAVHPDAKRWVLSEVLATLRNTKQGCILWAQARDNDFFA